MDINSNAKKSRTLLELHPSQIISGVFLTFIIIGTLLLKLPMATYDEISLTDALFTATSAACVTGLMVVDVQSTFTPFGQVVILALIQVGGLGIMTFGVFFTILLGQALSMKESSMVFETFDSSRRLSVRELLAKIMQLTFAIELVGVVALFLHWRSDFGSAKAAYMALFHAISGFCNAGICLFPDSLMSFSGDLTVNVILGCLIITGSFGFITIVELYYFGAQRRVGRMKISSMSLQSKMVLTYTFVLMLIGAFFIFFLERNGVLSDLSFSHQLTASLFQSITRTAGFVTVDFGEFTNATHYLFILLMFVGASPGSVGGGIKVTTFAVLIALAVSRYTAREKPSFLNRTIPNEVVTRSISILFISTQIVIFYTLLLLITESGDGAPQREVFLQVMFEVVSAFGTVGLSVGATENLSEIGKLLITSLMLIGRLGPLTVTLAVARKAPKGDYQYAEESVMVG